MRHEKEPWFELDGDALCLDFTNTLGDRPRCESDKLTGYASLVAWSRQSGALSDAEATAVSRAAARRPDEADAVFLDAIALRERLYRILAAPARTASADTGELTRFNEQLGRAFSHVRLVAGPAGLDWAWAGPAEALDRMLWPVLRSAAELLTSPRARRVRECHSDTCSWLFIDRSPGRRRRWCDMKSCGNRAKARRHYRRKKSASR